MELSSQMLLFAKVVESGSFSAAARALDHTPSAVSRQIGQLESRIGVRLLNRGKGGISVTEEGAAFYDRCRDVATSVSGAEEFIAAVGGQPRGTLRVVATVAFGKVRLLPVLPAFLEHYPELRLSLELTDRKVDLAEEGVDVAIRFTEQIDDDDVVARKLMHNKRLLCAAPSYIERYGAPERPEDLIEHNCLRLSTVTSWNDWGLDLPDGGGIEGNFDANSADAIYHAALAGIGVARLSTYLIGPDLASGRLVRVLRDYTDDDSDIFAIYSDRRNLSPKIRVFIDHLVETLGGSDSAGDQASVENSRNKRPSMLSNST